MRKLLAILLIATIACNGLVETFESINENTIFDYLDLDKEAIELGLKFLLKAQYIQSDNLHGIFRAIYMHLLLIA